MKRRPRLAPVVFDLGILNAPRAHLAFARAQLAIVLDDGVGMPLRLEAASKANMIAGRGGDALVAIRDDSATPPVVSAFADSLLHQVNEVLRSSCRLLHEAHRGARVIRILPAAPARFRVATAANDSGRAA